VDTTRTNLFDRRTAIRSDASASPDDPLGDGPGDALGAEELIGLVGRLEPFCLLADLGPCRDLSNSRGRRELAVRRLVPDARCGAASMFGVSVPGHCRGVAVTMIGTLGTALAHLPADSSEHPSVSGRLDTAVRLDLAVERNGATRARVTEVGTDHEPGPVVLDDDRGNGMLVDALHRVLGVACQGPTPSFADLVLGIWSRHLLLHLEEHGPISWRTAATLHPASVQRAHTPPSPEVLANACVTVRDDVDWERIRSDAASGRCAVPELAADEAAWMDAVMFGRWCVESYPPPSLVERELRTSGSDALDGFRDVVRLTRAADPDRRE